MAGFKQTGDSELISNINVTPFVDVVLVLLIIFMSTSTVIIRTALDLDIPVAANGAQKKDKPIWSVVMNHDKSLELNGEAIQRPMLVQRLKKEMNSRKKGNAGNGDPIRVLISAGGDHPYQEVVNLIDTVKGAGVGQVALNTKLPQQRDTASR